MYTRLLASHIKNAFSQYPVVTLTGPRQSGKTTLARTEFKQFDYVSLEDPDLRAIALEDPRGFLSRYPGSLILDEIQRCPNLTSYLQNQVDTPGNRRQFLLTGSHNLSLLESVSQTLAGRTRFFELLPLSLQEFKNAKKLPDLTTLLLQGGYPRIYDRGLNAHEWLRDYFRLYVERDLRSLLNVQELDKFETFVALLAGRVGQLVNFNSLATEAGVTQPTTKAWLAALKNTYVCFTLKPHLKNFNKRIVKTPKVYFYDTGLLCYLLKINSPDILDIHPLRGQVFENFVISETMKNVLNSAGDPQLYFWRDQKGHEVDLVEDKSHYLFPIEIKLSSTFNRAFTKNLDYLNKLQNYDKGKVIYTGDESFHYKNYDIVNWKHIG